MIGHKLQFNDMTVRIVNFKIVVFFLDPKRGCDLNFALSVTPAIKVVSKSYLS